MNKLFINNLLSLLSALLVAVLLIYIFSFSDLKFDLTQDKRFTLSDITYDVLQRMPEGITVKVYLDGDLPIGFQRMRTAIFEHLRQFRRISNDSIDFQFVDIQTFDKSLQNTMVKDLYEKGIEPTQVKIKDRKGNLVQKMIIPAALISFDGIDVPVNFLLNNPVFSAEENINASIQNIEYVLINTLNNLIVEEVERIAFLEGHGELNEFQVNDITRELAMYYQVDRGSINGDLNALLQYKAIIIAGPTQAFTNEDKYILDQYVMSGGKILWFIDGVTASIDSMNNGTTLAFIPDVNLSDQLFKYGYRINPNMILDFQCSLIPINMALAGSEPNFMPAPWLYFPLLQGSSEHVLSKNMNLVYSKFVSSIDTVGLLSNIQRHVVLHSSALSRLATAPKLISLAEVKEQPVKEMFDLRNIPTAILSEGIFESAFNNRPLNDLKLKGQHQFLSSSKPTAMLVVSDADIIRNDVRQTAQGTMITPLGFDKYTQQTFANKDFIVNAVNYMVSGGGILQLRNREVKLRLLDKAAILDKRIQYQLINTVMPLFILLIAAVILFYYRKRKYC